MVRRQTRRGSASRSVARGRHRSSQTGTGTLQAVADLSLTAMPTADELKRRIEAAIPGARAEVADLTGGGDHFRAVVEAPTFAGLNRIQQHRLVYDVFGAEVGGPIHALSIQTRPTPTAEAGP